MKVLRNPIVTVVLAILALGVVIYQIFAPRWRRDAEAGLQWEGDGPSARAVHQTPGKAEAAPPRVSLSAPASEAIMDRSFLEAHFTAWTESPRRDPFHWLGESARSEGIVETNSPVSNWKFKGIWDQTGSRVALINQGAYRVGDMIEGYKIANIESDQVWLRGPHRMERLGREKTGPTSGLPAPQTNLHENSRNQTAPNS